MGKTCEADSVAREEERCMERCFMRMSNCQSRPQQTSEVRVGKALLTFVFPATGALFFGERSGQPGIVFQLMSPFPSRWREEQYVLADTPDVLGLWRLWKLSWLLSSDAAGRREACYCLL